MGLQDTQHIPLASRRSSTATWPRLGVWLARDPRLAFATILTLYAGLGLTVLGFNRSPVQMLAIVFVGCVLDVLLTRALSGRWVAPLSAYITCCSLALLLNYSHASPWLLAPVMLALGSKHLLTFDGRHVFNPSMFGIAVSLLTMGHVITAAPAYQWAGGEVAMAAFIVMTALCLFVFRISKSTLIISFLICYGLQTGVRAWLMRHHIPPQMLFFGTLASPAFFIFVFYMLTDPKTSPRTARGAIAYSGAFALVDLALHAVESVFTIFYTALIMATGRFVFLHIERVFRIGLRASLAKARSRRPAWMLVGALAGALAMAIRTADSAGALSAPGFRFEAVPASVTGLRERPGHLLADVDPRLAHIGKWILSVGDAVAVGDVDGDGWQDLFLTTPFSDGRDRAALYRNLGGFRFERIPVPALAAYVHGHRRHGLPAGASIVDYDGDGDEDLMLAVAFGPSRLLRNKLRETGTLGFEDVTESVGLGHVHSVSLAATFLDANRDARLDLLLTNAMAASWVPRRPTYVPLHA
jgi:Na+-translocating ferredoxin:NAD+ oxidoreductase RnfD subunit